ncbi:MAG: MotA/TolQ/ExbB proton channel family protein [Candidatus Binatia bacterium]
MRTLVRIPLLMLLLALAPAPDAGAQEAGGGPPADDLALPDLSQFDTEPAGEAPGTAGAAPGGYTAWEIIQFGGITGYIIIALSVVGMGIVIESAIQIRRGRLMPQDVVDDTRKLLDSGRVDEAVRRVADEKSFVGYVVARGLRERDRGYEAMVKAMEDAADEATGARLRRVEHLNIIANISTMLGLLGTVLGLTNNFNQISQAVGGVEPRMLAAGIFQALITTVMGLIVAIPSLYFYSFFRNRVDAIITEATIAAEHMTEIFKDGRGAKVPRAEAGAR